MNLCHRVACSLEPVGPRRGTSTRRGALALLIGSPPAFWSTRSSHAVSDISWTYQDSWGGTCKEGTMQSPIRLDETSAVDVAETIAKGEEPLVLDISAVPEQLRNATVTNNNHGSPQINVPERSSGVKFDGDGYDLVQIHFHSPSEHFLNNQRTAMEAHLVHVSHDDAKKILVIAVLLEKGEKQNEVLQEALSNLPVTPINGDAVSFHQSIPLRSLLLPSTDASQNSSPPFYYSYTGSLTTPPCSEPVTWLVQSKVGSITPDQLEKFAALSVIPGNARSIQDQTGRTIVKVGSKFKN